jgi:nicotinate phosphoribosyltransferase
MNGLLTDLYQLTMAAGFHLAGKTGDRAVFELFLRRLPPNRNFMVAAGLQQAVEYLLNLSFGEEEVRYLKSLSQFARMPEEFFDALRRFRFTGDLFAVPEGTPLFPGEPFLTVRAPLMEAQIPETYLLATIGFQSLIATKSARIVEAAGGRSVVEFGTRRAHSPEAGVLAARASYIGGCIGTSNTLAGFRYEIPVFGTAAHSWVQAFQSESEAFRRLQDLLGPATVYLIDTYDTLEGARHAAALGSPFWGVRLDSGNLAELARAVRRILDDAGFPDAKIMATGDLNEHKILEFVANNAPIDVFGVGTELVISSDAPNHGAIYKMVELESGGERRFTAKYSADKSTLPGAKQVFRYAKRDMLGVADESPKATDCEALLRPVIFGGKLIEPLPTAAEARANALESVHRLPKKLRSLFECDPPWPVDLSPKLRGLAESVKSRMEGNGN